MKAQYLVRFSVAVEVDANSKQDAIRIARDILGQAELSETPVMLSATNLDALEEGTAHDVA